MKKKPLYPTTLIEPIKVLEGETIELKIARLLENNEPIDDGAPVIYTARKDGVDPAYNIRTDRFEIAAEMMDKVNRDRLAKTEGTPSPEGDKPEGNKPDGKEPEGREIKVEFGKPESTAGTAKK